MPLNAFIPLSVRAKCFGRIILPICVALTVLFIFSNSSDIGDVPWAEDVSGGKSLFVTNLLNGVLNKLAIPIQFTEQIVRKLAHLTEYALLGFLLMLTVLVYTERLLPRIACPPILGLVTAFADEWYQLFVPGRSGQLTDVLIDFCGILSGVAAAWLSLHIAFSITNKQRKRHARL